MRAKEWRDSKSLHSPIEHRQYHRPASIPSSRCPIACLTSTTSRLWKQWCGRCVKGMVMQTVEEDKNEMGVVNLYVGNLPNEMDVVWLGQIFNHYEQVVIDVALRSAFSCASIGLAEDGGLDWNVLEGVVTACRRCLQRMADLIGMCLRV
ncbi:hypothetical protein RHGRI_014231 [Rhododendron griersonianum]|uniref:Uncharacterized protein n=1 Tax=Rhododendron griersonianum TaxID=479676 RepID=A0AAV6K8Y7_9ERIC|nr:hypothetical protein RHGRI_014231 [Rhododendron griersonianum]